MTKDNQTAIDTDDQHKTDDQQNATVQTEGEEAPSPVTSEVAEPPAAPGEIGLEESRSPTELAHMLEEAQRKLEEAKKKADEHWDALLRLQAEMENLRKRSAKEVENAHKYGLDRFLSELLPVKDSMELGVSAASEETVEVAHVREGLELTLKMLRTAMEKFGVEEVDPQGDAFDPERHQAMSVQEMENVTSGTVLTVVQKGYLLNGRLVRPAMVIVAK